MSCSFTGLCIAFGYVALKILCHYNAFSYVLKLISRMYVLIDVLIGFFTQKWVKNVFILFYNIFLIPKILASIILYSLCFGAWIYSQQLHQINKKFARVLSLPVWLENFIAFREILKNFSRIVLLVHLSDFFGFFRVFIFSFLSILLMLISAGIIGANNGENEHHDGEEVEQQQQTMVFIRKILLNIL